MKSWQDYKARGGTRDDRSLRIEIKGGRTDFRGVFHAIINSIVTINEHKLIMTWKRLNSRVINRARFINE